MKIVQVGTNKGYDDLANHLLSNYDSLEFGLFVEPNQLHIESIKKCYEKYDNVIIENIAVKVPSQEKDFLTIYYHTNDYPDYQLSSCNIEHINNHLWCPHLWRGGEGEIKSFDVPCITLEDLFDKYSITELDWLYLDVEGIDSEILLTTDWKKYKIKRIEFEHLHLGEYSDQIYKMMVDMGYTQVSSLHEYDWAFEKNNQKLKNFPSIHYISIKESENRRSILEEQFKKYGITNVVPHIFERYNPVDYEIETTEWWGKDKEGYLGATTSHLKAIKEWYDNTDEPYAFFCEDDISFDSVDYWNFTWEEFFDALPYDWSCVQLVLFRNDMFRFFQPEVHLRHRCWCDGSATGYLISREHAKNILDRYYVDGRKFILKYQGSDISVRDDWALYPTTEAIVYSIFDKSVYVFPLFVENPNFYTTVWDLNGEVPQFHWPCYNTIMEWWKTRGKELSLNDFFISINDTINKEKLKNFPPIHFISIEQSEDRRKALYEKFEKNGLTNIHPHIFKRYDEYSFDFVSSSDNIKITGPGIGPLTSHLKAIKDWYFDTDEEYAFFCEDDISFETVHYWKFTWEQFFNSLPSDWGCVQLCWVREYQHMFDFSVEVRTRCWCDWSACAYLIRRSHAKKLISHYYRNGEFNLDYIGEDMNTRPHWARKPNAETIIFSLISKVYGFPLFVEDVLSYFPDLQTLINKETDHNARAHNTYSYSEIVNWWKTEGKDFIP